MEQDMLAILRALRPSKLPTNKAGVESPVKYPTLLEETERNYGREEYH